jgi:hypothetical protein
MVRRIRPILPGLEELVTLDARNSRDPDGHGPLTHKEVNVLALALFLARKRPKVSRPRRPA